MRYLIPILLALVIPQPAAAPLAPSLEECQWRSHDAIVGWQEDLAWEMEARGDLAINGPICDTLCKCMGYDVAFPTIFGGE